MSFLFDTPSPPQPAPAPQSPMAPDNTAAERKRQDAETAALAESKSAGRRSTIVAGMKLAEDQQYDRGLMSQRKRASAAARDLGG